MDKIIVECDICGKEYKTSLDDENAHYTNYDLYGVPNDHQIAPFVCSLKCARKTYGKTSFVNELKFLRNKFRNRFLK